MSVASSNLISLLRMLDDTLPADVAVRLRERLADDVEFADQFRRVTKAMQQEVTAEKLLDHIDDVDPFDVAEFVEGTMTDEQQSEFEQRCWDSESLLCEVISAWKATNDAALTESETTTSERAHTVVSSLLGSSSAEAETRPVPAEQPEAAPSVTAGTQLPADDVSIALKETEQSILDRPRRDSGLFIVIAGVAVALVLVAFQFFGRTTPDQIAHPEPDRSPSEGSHDEHRNVAQDDSADVIIPDGTVPRSPDDQEPHNDSKPQIAQDDTPRDMNRTPQETRGPQSTTPDSPEAPSPDKRVVALVDWSDITGIAGAKSADSDVWSGIHSRVVNDLWKPNARSQLMTLSHSRASGDIPGGARAIADAESLIEFGTEASNDDSASDSDAAQTAPLVAVQRGRLAIDGLQNGQRVLVQVDGQTIDVEATRNNSTIAIERIAGETVVAAYRGEVRAGDRKLTRRLWGRLNSSGEVTAFRPQRPTDWYRDSADAVALSPVLCDAFNTATDIVQVAARFESSPDSLTGTIASQVALRCTVAAAQAIPVNLARKLAASNNETHRLTLVHWLITRFREDTVTGESDLRVICRVQQADQTTTAAMRSWFRSASAGLPPTTTQLTQLMTGLRDTSPLFTRQCAKYFLQQILNDPLTEYVPTAATSRTAMSSIARKVRAWQQSNQ